MFHTKLPTTITKMSHFIINFKSMLIIAVVFSVAFGAPSKDPSEPSTEISESESSITMNNDSVSATTSIGGFNEAASLADNDSAVASADGNGLSASSGYGPGSIIDVSELPSTGKPMKPATGTLMKKAKVELFGKIIKIANNVLQSINAYLNEKLMNIGQTEAAISCDESAGASGNGTACASKMVPTKSNNDTIFNIPITVWRYVQNLFKWMAEKKCNHGICNSGAH